MFEKIYFGYREKLHQRLELLCGVYTRCTLTQNKNEKSNEVKGRLTTRKSETSFWLCHSYFFARNSRKLKSVFLKASGKFGPAFKLCCAF